ncbi:MAG: RhuM family protein [Desulfuromonadaceae bacterium]|nr:RhuM family protein [Desulfuromonadaceae bacterium]
MERTVCREFRHTVEDGKEYSTKFYILDAIISVGYCVNSARATLFRQWATSVLHDFAIRRFLACQNFLPCHLLLNYVINSRYSIHTPRTDPVVSLFDR